MCSSCRFPMPPKMVMQHFRMCIFTVHVLHFHAKILDMLLLTKGWFLWIENTFFSNICHVSTDNWQKSVKYCENLCWFLEYLLLMETFSKILRMISLIHKVCLHERETFLNYWECLRLLKECLNEKKHISDILKQMECIVLTWIILIKLTFTFLKHWECLQDIILSLWKANMFF